MEKKRLKNCARKLWFLCNALHNISTIMHIKFEDVQAIDDSYIPDKQKKNVKKINQRDIIHEVQL